ncbi:hypothetical protein HDU85_001438 [Gaertneriomyces sp. JEL0708]|nr:hypothetical protein HDU85_001438 [Gaertneriomyces sp. JEL0708]
MDIESISTAYADLSQEIDTYFSVSPFEELWPHNSYDYGEFPTSSTSGVITSSSPLPPSPVNIKGENEVQTPSEEDELEKPLIPEYEEPDLADELLWINEHLFKDEQIMPQGLPPDDTVRDGLTSPQRQHLPNPVASRHSVGNEGRRVIPASTFLQTPRQRALSTAVLHPQQVKLESKVTVKQEATSPQDIQPSIPLNAATGVQPSYVAESQPRDPFSVYMQTARQVLQPRHPLCPQALPQGSCRQYPHAAASRSGQATSISGKASRRQGPPPQSSKDQRTHDSQRSAPDFFLAVMQPVLANGPGPNNGTALQAVDWAVEQLALHLRLQGVSDEDLSRMAALEDTRFQRIIEQQRTRTGEPISDSVGSAMTENRNGRRKT